MHVVSPFSNHTLPFSFRMPKKLYHEMVSRGNKNTTCTIAVVDIYSSLKNWYSFEVEPIACRPGFKFHEKSMECECNRDLDAIER